MTNEIELIEETMSPYVGKTISLTIDSAGFEGTCRGLDIEGGYLELLPHITICADNKHARLERETPVRIGLGVLFDQRRYVIRPLNEENYLEKRVKSIN